jgi:hypothetical protein
MLSGTREWWSLVKNRKMGIPKLKALNPYFMAGNLIFETHGV